MLKLDPQGRETWRYHGQVLQSLPDRVVLEARFDREDRLFHGMPLRRGDRFLETYFTDRWYNIYEIHDREDGSIKGWYCNVGKPAVEEAEGVISYVDLALDLWVAADGTQTVLDEDEFAALNPSPELRQQAYKALDQLQNNFNMSFRTK